jgi:hypothetical protein
MPAVGGAGKIAFHQLPTAGWLIFSGVIHIIWIGLPDRLAAFEIICPEQGIVFRCSVSAENVGTARFFGWDVVVHRQLRGLGQAIGRKNGKS